MILSKILMGLSMHYSCWLTDLSGKWFILYHYVINEVGYMQSVFEGC